jgi:glyoxylase I family protein
MRVHHLAFRTQDVAKVSAFYTKLGLGKAELRPNGSHWLTLEGSILMIEQAEPGEPEVPAWSMDFCAFSLSASRDEARRRIAEAGSTVEHETEYTLYFRDPDGRRIGFSSYERDVLVLRTREPRTSTP